MQERRKNKQVQYIILILIVCGLTALLFLFFSSFDNQIRIQTKLFKMQPSFDIFQTKFVNSTIMPKINF